MPEKQTPEERYKQSVKWLQYGDEFSRSHAYVILSRLSELEEEIRAAEFRIVQLVGTDKNEYHPWESEGITEVDYWKKRYIETRQGEDGKQSRLDKIATVADYEMNNVDGPAYRILRDILTLAKGTQT